MHREIEQFIAAALEQLEAKKWDKSDLIQHAGVGGTTIATILRGDLVSQKSIRKIGQALEIQPSTINSAVGVSKPWRANLTVRKVEEPEKPTAATVKEKLQQAWRDFEHGREVLADIEEDIEKVLKDVNEELRLIDGVNGLRKHLLAFRK